MCGKGTLGGPLEQINPHRPSALPCPGEHPRTPTGRSSPQRAPGPRSGGARGDPAYRSGGPCRRGPGRLADRAAVRVRGRRPGTGATDVPARVDRRRAVPRCERRGRARLRDRHAPGRGGLRPLLLRQLDELPLRHGGRARSAGSSRAGRGRALDHRRAPDAGPSRRGPGPHRQGARGHDGAGAAARPLERQGPCRWGFGGGWRRQRIERSGPGCCRSSSEPGHPSHPPQQPTSLCRLRSPPCSTDSASRALSPAGAGSGPVPSPRPPARRTGAPAAATRAGLPAAHRSGPRPVGSRSRRG